MLRRTDTWICDTCRDPACKGGCYYTPGTIEFRLGKLPDDVQTITNPNNYGLRRSSGAKNPMETSWAIRADLERALAYVRRSRPNGPSIEQVVWLAYVGVPTGTAERPGRYAGQSDASIARLLGMADETVGRYRRQGIALMVEFLNPEYRREEGE